MRAGAIFLSCLKQLKNCAKSSWILVHSIYFVFACLKEHDVGGGRKEGRADEEV